MENIILNGMDLTQLKASLDAYQKEAALVRSKIQKDAAKYIADSMKEAISTMTTMLENTEDTIEFHHQSLKATEILKNVKFVSDVSGVAYYMPYYDRQGGYNPDGSPFSSQLDDLEIDSDLYSELASILEDMESDVSDWNTSTC